MQMQARQFYATRPKPPYGRQGQAGSWGKDTVRRVHFDVFSTSRFGPPALNLDWILLINCGNSSDGIVGLYYILGWIHISIFATTLQYFCNIFFAFLQHVPSTLRLNGTPLVQKMSCHEHGAPTGVLWCKKRHVANTGPQPTSMIKNASLTQGLNRPP